MKITSRRLLALAVATVLAGCSSSATHSTAKAKAHVAHAAHYRPGPADDAAVIASHIPGCTGAAAGDVGAGAPDMTSTASCTLDGHVVIVDVWSSPRTRAYVGMAGLAEPDSVAYAYGSTWSVFLADEGATAATTTLQMQLTNDAAGLLGASTRVAPLATQTALVGRVSRALGGSTATA